MPSFGYDNYRERCAALKRRKAKLLAKGIVPNSSKWFKLLHRR